MKTQKSTTLILLTALVLMLVQFNSTVSALTRVQDIARPVGERTNRLMNWGLVVGLNGKGDGGDVLITARPLMTMLQKMGNPGEIDEFKSSKNVALVMVTADLPRNGIRNGDQVDVTVSCIGKASSLDGGILLMTPLRSANYTDDTLYAWAQGTVSIQNEDNPTTGIVKNGAVMEVDFVHSYVDRDANNRAYFDLVLDSDQANWQTAHSIAMYIDALNSPPGEELGNVLADADITMQRTAIAVDPRNIRVYIPEKRAVNPAAYISSVMSMVVDLPDPEATIVIHEKTGTIAITGNVEISPCSVTVPGLMIRIDPTPQQGAQVTTPQTSQWSKFDTVKEKGTAAKLDDLISALDQLNVDVEQKINAIYALRDAGALRARIKTE